MACMIEQGVVDLADPEGSSLIEHIGLGDPNSAVFSVDTERQAMLAWLGWGAACFGSTCGVIEDPCGSGDGAATTGHLPLGNCEENDSVAAFWDALMVERSRCAPCHSSIGRAQGEGSQCGTDAHCQEPRVCLEGRCWQPGRYYAPGFFDGPPTGALHWSNETHRQYGLNSLYNVVALGLVDLDSPLDSRLLVKPLAEGFQPTAVLGDGVDIVQVADGTGLGAAHGGADKFHFGCRADNCPTRAPIDCRNDRPCDGDGDGACADGEACIADRGHSYCRLEGALCDPTYVNIVRFIQGLAACR
jgi:hypothetical protein